MNTKQRWIQGLILVVVAIFGLWILYPKQWIRGGLVGGPLQPYAMAYREEFSCIGLKLILPPVNCVDCGGSYPCFGVLIHKTCSIETYDPNVGVRQTSVPCRDG